MNITHIGTFAPGAQPTVVSLADFLSNALQPAGYENEDDRRIRTEIVLTTLATAMARAGLLTAEDLSRIADRDNLTITSITD